MGFRWPLLVVGAFEFDAVDNESRGISAVSELVSHSDFADSCQVVHIIGFNIGTGEVLNVSIEEKLRGGFFCDVDRLSDLAHGATAISA